MFLTELEVQAIHNVEKKKVEIINFGNAKRWNEHAELSNRSAV